MWVAGGWRVLSGRQGVGEAPGTSPAAAVVVAAGGASLTGHYKCSSAPPSRTERSTSAASAYSYC